MGTESLMFVYNADSGLFNLVTDIAHKIFSPKTYACQLCNITHGNLKMHDEWKTFIKALPLDCTFMHRDEFVASYSDIKDELPAVYLFSPGQQLQHCISANEINGCNNLSDLKNLIQSSCVAMSEYRSLPDLTV